VPDIGGRDLVREWQRAMEGVLGSVSKAEVPGALLEPIQRQLQLVQELLAPVDAAFELLEQTGQSLRHQAEALEAAARALQETAGLMKVQAELYERTIAGTARHPAKLVKAARGGSARRSRGS
jgi:hypothetical protein